MHGSERQILFSGWEQVFSFALDLSLMNIVVYTSRESAERFTESINWCTLLGSSLSARFSLGILKEITGYTKQHGAQKKKKKALL